MGVKIYYLVVAAVVVFGFLLPQEGKQRKIYIVLMAALHAFICGWRYKYLTGDLMKYAWGYMYTIPQNGWFSDEVWNGGRNFGFFWLNKLVAAVSDNDFQVLLIVIAVITEAAVAYIIWRYAHRPWLSYLIWNCFGFYIFGFSAIKQALAMAVIMWAFTAIMDEKPLKFVLITLLAGCIHGPALIFLPAYPIARSRLTVRRFGLYAAFAALVYLFRNPIVTFVSSFYYEETDFAVNDRLGLRFLMIVALIAAGIMLRGFGGKRFSKLLNLMVVAAMLQMFSGFDNVFTRLTDYYFQFVILYLPMMLYTEEDDAAGDNQAIRHIVLTPGQRTAAVACVAVLAFWYYYHTNLGAAIDYSVDNYLNYRFCWEVG